MEHGADPILSARGIEKRFGGVRALKGVDLDLREGEILGLIGPNGSGKTTFVNCLSRTLKADRGRIFLGGKDVTRLRSYQMARRGLTRTFQLPRVYRELSVWENALSARDWAHMDIRGLFRSADQATRDRAHELLELVGLTHMIDEPASSLSGGQERLLELVLTMMPQPSVVMLDEATSGINPSLIEVLKSYLLALREQEGLAIMLVEHNTGFIFSIAERIVVLDQGTTLASGSPESIQNDRKVIDSYLGA